MESGLNLELSIDERTFRFELCRNQGLQWGAAVIDQWWMPITVLYGQRQARRSGNSNHQVVIEYYWAACQREQAGHVRSAMERYLLASLLPEMRSAGSRRIFDDAFMRPGGRSVRIREVHELNTLLSQSREKSFSADEFHSETSKLLSPVEFPLGIQATHRQLSSQLLDDACCHLEQHGNQIKAVAMIRDHWKDLMSRFSRRSEFVTEKTVLDALTYEARAALHHCYAVVWASLIPTLAQERGLDPISLRFLAFWHMSPVEESRSTANHCWSLFHGHAFGLHPGTSRFLLTSVGQEMMGCWLVDEDRHVAYGRLLHGLYIAIYDYSERRRQSTDNRRQQGLSQRSGR